MTTEERKSILQQQIFQHVSQGWQVASQTDTTAQLVLKAKKGCLRILFLGIFAFGKKEKQLYISVDENGAVQKVKNKR